MPLYARVLIVVAAALLFLLFGDPILAERAERATVTPLLGLLMGAAALKEMRTRRWAIAGAVVLVIAAGASLAFHSAVNRYFDMPARPAEVAWTALFYAGAASAVVVVFTAARRAGGVAVALPLAVVFAIGYVPPKALIHRPKLLGGRTPAAISPEAAERAQDVTLTTRDGWRLAATYIPAPATVTASAPDGRTGAVIVAHGVMAEKSMYFPSYGKLVHGLGYAALFFDFRGHGESDGHVQTYGAREVEDVRAAVEWLRARPEVDPARIAIVGHSMGAAISILAAAELPEIRAVVADAGYDDLRRIAARRMRLGFLPDAAGAVLADASIGIGRLETGIRPAPPQPIERIAAIAPRPVLLIHGDQDRSTDPECSRRLYEAAGEPRELLILPGVKHARHLDRFPPIYRERFAEFLRRAFAAPSN